MTEVLEAASPTLPQMPMSINESNSLPTRWLQKGLLGCRTLDNMETLAHWTHQGFGAMELTRAHAMDGSTSLRLVSPTVGDKASWPVGRPFGEAVARRGFDHENWTAYNRLSFWVYPTLPGFKVISLLVTLSNDGAVKLPNHDMREGLNFFLLKPNQWNHIVWEIPDLSRDQVTGVSFIYRLQGHEPGAASSVCFDIDQLELQAVVADHYEGWTVAPGAIAYSQSGYLAGGTKSALATGLDAGYFHLINMQTGEKTAIRPVRTVSNTIGAVQVLDFSDIREPGEYVIRAGDAVTRPFQIHDDIWRETIWKTLNLFCCERCGEAIPGIHDVCHKDWRATHNGKTITINGGWHDAGDLSQGVVNTAEATYAMLALAEHLQTQAAWAGTNATDPLDGRLIHEAKWGLDWVLKTRFGDGARVTWATMDFWTDGVPGTLDDVQGEVHKSAFENFIAASTEARAGRLLKSSDPVLAAKSLKAAQEDWHFALEQGTTPSLEWAAAGAQASLDLYEATGDQVYSSMAVELARVILACQQTQYTSWQVPMAGFFYTETDKKHLLHYNHRGHDQAPVVALSRLCRLFPGHAEWMSWYGSVALYSEHLKTASCYTDPYGMLPAGIYDLKSSNEPWYMAQVQKGFALGSQYYLRCFPAWTSFRGNHGTLLSMTKGLSSAAQLRNSLDLSALGQKQLQWVVGRNPFAQSTMCGEGYDFAPQYTAMSGAMVGSLPVGIQTRNNEDTPYWPAANCYNYKEVWVHPSARWLWLMTDLNGPAVIRGVGRPKINRPVIFKDMATGYAYTFEADQNTGQFVAQVPEGRYLVTHGERERNIIVLPGSKHSLDLTSSLKWRAAGDTVDTDRVVVDLFLEGDGVHKFKLQSWNLEVEQPEQTVQLKVGESQTLRWICHMKNRQQMWLGLVIPDGNLENRIEVTGKLPRYNLW